MALGIALRSQRKMLYSLRLAILMAMLAIAIVTIVTITLFASLATRVEFSRFVEVGRDLRNEQLQEVILTYWDADVIGLNTNLLSTTGNAILESGMSGIVLNPSNFRLFPLTDDMETFDPNSTTFLDDASNIRFEIASDGNVQVFNDELPVGMMYIDPINDIELMPAQIDFVQSVNGGFLLAAGLAALAAVGLTLYLSRQILRPIGKLTQAAHDLEAGNLSQRVQTSTRGEIGELAHAFNAMAESLAQNEKLRQQMVTDIAHELRTPLTNLRGYLEAIQDGLVKPDENTINLLYEEAIHLNQLVQDLQELAMAEAGQLRFIKQAVTIDQVIKQTIAIAEPNASRKEITIDTNIPPNIPDVLADQKRVSQILRNLLNNAINYTNEQGTIFVRIQNTNKHVIISVKDTGEGIAEKHLPYLFERFYRVDPSRSRITGGAGLGLAIVKHLVEAQGGEITVSSTVGIGTEFTFTLPIFDEQITGIVI